MKLFYANFKFNNTIVELVKDFTGQNYKTYKTLLNVDNKATVYDKIHQILN